jgi:hypothetical protein
MRQAKSRKSLGLMWVAQRRSGPPSPGQELPMAPALIDYWMWVIWSTASHRLSQVLEAPKGQKHALWAGGVHLGPPLTMLPFVFPFLTFNKLPLHPLVLSWILSGGIGRIWNSSDQTAPAPLIYLARQPGVSYKGKMLCLLICFLLSHSSLPFTHQHLTQSILLGDAGNALLAQPHVVWGTWGLVHPQAAVVTSW